MGRLIDLTNKKFGRLFVNGPIGCALAELSAHLEKQFKNGMTWQNYGQWHIDHIIPCAKFDLTDSEQQRKCFHFSNLQPLWAIENIVKSNKLVFVPT
jgi:hypothetical protein